MTCDGLATANLTRQIAAVAAVRLRKEHVAPTAAVSRIVHDSVGTPGPSTKIVTFLVPVFDGFCAFVNVTSRFSPGPTYANISWTPRTNVPGGLIACGAGTSPASMPARASPCATVIGADLATPVPLRRLPWRRLSTPDAKSFRSARPFDRAVVVTPAGNTTWTT